MHISITGPDDIRENGFRESVGSRLMRTLSRFSRRIARIDVAITDVNASRGGVDKHCRVRVRMPGFEPFVATAKGESPWVAVTRAGARARRMVMTKLKRPRSQRVRRQRERWRNSDTLDINHMENQR